eukprot:1160658-Pelagomonas_calceolata.AAC.4
MLGPFHHEFAPKCVQVNTGNVWSTSGSHCHSKLWCLDHLSGKAPLSKSAAAGVGCAAAASARCPCLSDRIGMMRELRVLVCDEADNLLDMGFKPTIVKILQNLPPKDQRQALLFSATFPADVKDLAKFALKDLDPAVNDA